MAHAARHLALLGLTLPTALLGYHVLAGGSGALSHATQASDRITDMVSEVTGKRPRLRDLSLLERDLYYVEQFYVDQERIDFDRMFQASLERVERSVAGVLFSRRPGGSRLQVSVGTYNTVLSVEPIREFDQLNDELRRVAAILDAHLPPDVDRAEVEYDLINGLLSTLDPHSLLLPPVAAREMAVDNQGEFGGLGIEITIQDGRLTVKAPIEGTPADAAGMQAGDQIVRIEDESTVNMDLNDAVSRLRGEVDTPVRILVKRKRSPDPVPMTIVRARIKVNPVEGQLLDGDIGYIVIKSFHGNVSEDLDLLLDSLSAEAGGRMAGLVLDLRDNPGGYLNQAVAVSDRFLSEGVLVATEEGSGRREEQHASRSGSQVDYPIAVLVNGNSASASEIVAGALKNLGRAVIVGERTFGKGSVQHLYPGRDDSTLKLTVARYLTPGDHSIQAIGIPPDVLLVPSLVWPAEADAEDQNPLVSLYWREWIEREADLDQAFGQWEELEDAPAYSVRFHRDRRDPKERRKAVQDWEVGFARDLLAAAEGPSRVDVLQSGADVVERYRAEGEAQLKARFSAIGIDWSPGVNPASVPASLSLDLGPDGVLVAGEPEDVTLSITNDSDQDLWRISAVTRSDHPLFEEDEFYFGHIPAGETRSARQRMVVPDGWLREHVELEVELRDPDHPVLARFPRSVEVHGGPRPSFAYRYELIDDGTRGTSGDGDGIPEVGEKVALRVEVENTGEGVARDGHVRLRNRSGRPLDLERGNLQVGHPRLATGETCELDRDDGCAPTLAPGETFEGWLHFSLRSAPEEGAWKVDLTVGDNERFDRGTVIRGGFYEFFQLEESIALVPGEAPDTTWRRPPVIELTRVPEVVTSDAVVSGRVTDDDGVQDVVVFHGEQKIFYRGGSGDPTVPFTVEPELQPGSNLLVIITRDTEGLTSTHSLSVWSPEPAQTAHSHAVQVTPTP